MNGYWPTRYWPVTDYYFWVVDYWPEYGEAAGGFAFSQVIIIG